MTAFSRSNIIMKNGKKEIHEDGNGRCELCGKETKLTKHHLIPQNVSRSNKYPKSLKTDESNFLMICSECHSSIHGFYTNQELRDLYYTKELLMESEEFGRYLSWKVKHPDFKGSSKMSNRRRK